MPQSLPHEAVAAYRAGILKIAEGAPEPIRAQLCELAQAGAPGAPGKRPVAKVGLFRRRLRVVSDTRGVAGLEYALLSGLLAVGIIIPLERLAAFLQAAIQHVHAAGL